MATFLKATAKKVILVCVIVAVWWTFSLEANPFFLPSPQRVFDAFMANVRNGTLHMAVIYSFLRITMATFVSGIVAIPLGLFIHNTVLGKDWIAPVVSVFRFAPVTAFYPLLISWFGIGEEMKIAFLFVAMFVYMLPSVVLCLNEVNPNLIDTGLTIGMSKMQTIARIQVPASLPSIMESFAMMYGIGFTYIAVVETVNAKFGLGFIIQQSASRGKTDYVFMAIIVIMAISVCFDFVANLAIRKTFKWKYINDD